MKKIYLIATVLMLNHLAYGQFTETEPNNSFATANVATSFPDTISGSLGAADVSDFFKPNINYVLSHYTHSNITVILTVTNTGATSSLFNLKMYNHLRQSGLVFNEDLTGAPIAAGDTVSEYMHLCGEALDSMYFELNSTGNFDYYFQTYAGNSVNDLEPNNTRAEASLNVNFALPTYSGIEYSLVNGQPQKDTIDYHKIVFTTAAFVDPLVFHAQNNSCNNGQHIAYELFKNDSPTPFANGNIGNNNNVFSYEEINSTIPINNFVIGDSLTIKITSSGAFIYDYQFSTGGGGGGSSHDDMEDNCCDYNAIPMPENTTMYGNVGLYDYNLDEYIDEFDTYKIVLTQTGNINFNITAENQECHPGQHILYYNVLDENGNEISYNNYLMYWNDPDCLAPLNQTGQQKNHAWEPGTYYIQLYTYSSFQSSTHINYELSYQQVDVLNEPNPEPNNTPATATLINAGDTIVDRIQYKSSNEDDVDFYKVHLPQDGTLKLYVKATYLYVATNNQYLTQFIIGKSGFTNEYIPNNPPVTNVTPEAVYYDTIVYCRLEAGDQLFSVSSNYPYRYQIITELIPDDPSFADAEPNNSFETAALILPGDTTKGRISYFNADGIRDDLDYFKLVYLSADSLKIKFSATNTTCRGGNRLEFDIYNKNRTLISHRTIANNNNVGTGETITDSLKLWIATPDTIYIKMDGFDGFQYQFIANLQKPTSAFTINGDTTACLGQEIYKAQNLTTDSVGFHWSLPDGGGTITWVDSIATVNWNTTGSKRVQLYLSNQAGVSVTKSLNVGVSNQAPTQIPLAFNFSRNLSTQAVPVGTYPQWFNNNVAIAGATDSVYFALAAGTYTVKFVNECGSGPASNSFHFPLAAQTQTINFPHLADLVMAPNLKAKLLATASSNLPVFYQKISGAVNIVNDSLFISGAGKIVIKASQPGDDVYLPATMVIDTITVLKGNQTIAMDSIPLQIYNDTFLIPVTHSAQGQYVEVNVVSGNVQEYDPGRFIKKGVGLATLRASQAGDANYLPATPVERTFCIGVRKLGPIIGDQSPCLSTYTYVTEKIPGALYQWSISGGGTLTSHNDTAWVQWNTAGTHSIKVKANSPCDATYTNERTLQITTSPNLPQPVTNMLPIDHAQNQQLPLQLSWIPGSNSSQYDLYIWDSALAQPATPFASNLPNLTFDLPQNSFSYNKTYKWKIVSKNPCTSTDGPIQHFSIVALPDLAITNISIPSAVNSGQTITINWTIKNVGPGNTSTLQSWNDAVFLSFDTMPNFVRPPELRGPSWSMTQIPIRPLLLGSKPNVTALDSGQSYTNSISYTLPLNYSQPLYVYVISNYGGGYYKPLQVTKINDTARANGFIDVTLSPTPDLRVDTVFAPAIAFSGSTINLSYKVKNYGVLAPTGATWTDQVYISQSILFNEENAIEIKVPKANGTYYPDMYNAVLDQNTQILAGGVYTKNIDIVLPNFIFGNWFLHVKTNSDKNLYEGALANNNIGNLPIQIFLTPTPKLTVSTINVPIAVASTTQPVGASWNIKNEGFYDNVEAHQGHFLNSVLFHCPCYAPLGSVCLGNPIYVDSTAWGSSYWIDRVYLSTNPNDLVPAQAILINEVKQGLKPNAGLDFLEDVFNTCDAPALRGGAHNTQHALKPNGNYPNHLNFAIPDDLAEGDYYVYVHTNASKSVFEYPGTAQIKRSSLPITVHRPNVSVPNVSAPAQVTGLETFNISYTVSNTGAGTVYQHLRKDKIYVSIFPNFDGNAQLIDTKTYTETIAAGGTVTHQVAYAFPAATSGNRYFYVHSNFDSSFKETNAQNNLSLASNAVLVATALPADLIVANIQLADTIPAPATNKFVYTVNNVSAHTINQSWIDSLFVSCSPIFDPGNCYFLGAKTQYRTLGGNTGYTDTISVYLSNLWYEYSNCFPEAQLGNAYFFIKTNANNGAYEGSNNHNNLNSSGLKIIKNLLVDHIITAVQAPLSFTTGQQETISYTIKNIGDYPNNAYYYERYRDGIYFSPDSVFNSNAVLALGYLNYTKIHKNASVSFTKNVVVPNIPTGNYYIHANTNYYNYIRAELNLSNNTNVLRNAQGTAQLVQVVRPILPDLVDSFISVPTVVAPGQPFQIIRRISNIGAGPSTPSYFHNSIWFSNNTTLSNDDEYLNVSDRDQPLLPGEYYDDTILITVPHNVLEGNYYLIGIANSNPNFFVYETDMDNNRAFQIISVIVPERADLYVEHISLPDTLLLGYPIDTAKWVVKNESSNSAIGYSKDGIYFSSSPVFDSSAVLMGIITKNINLLPLQADTVKLRALLQNIVPGDYYVYVKTDLVNNIFETNKDNNTSRMEAPVHIKIKELPLHVLSPNTLQQTPRFYKLMLPDSLLGATIKVTLKTTDSNLVHNEMYIASHYIPTAAQFQYRFNTPNYGNQQIVISDVNSNSFYITVVCATPQAALQNITLYAEKLPFAIAAVQTNSGGNIGNVTVKISGSLFKDSMQAKLTNGGTVINATKVYFVNSTTVFATFPLQGQPLGVYEVSLIKTDATEAVLPNGFSIVTANNGGLITGGGNNTGSGNGNEPGCDPGAASGLNSQLVVELVVPPKVVTNWPFIIQINFNNPTNYDIPAQTKILYSEEGLKLALTAAGVATGSTALYLEFSEAGGPPGIIRAGGSGTITVYTKSPGRVPLDPIVLFKLK